MIAFRYLLLLSCLLLVSCDNTENTRQAKFYAFGTEIDVSLWGVDEQTADNTVTDLEQAFSNINHTWHAWQPSTLTEINQAISANRPINITPDVAALIKQAHQLAVASQNLFNPAAGKLFELWGFHRDNWFESHPPPADKAIAAWLSDPPTMDDIHIMDGQLWSDNTNVKLGFGGFAKGYAVDEAIAVLQQQGIENAIINIGGDLRAIGQHGERPWIIGIRHPRQSGMIASIALQNDESVFTSGDYERFFQYEGVRYPHILDPRTGSPAKGVMSATVLHSNAATADAAATALYVAGDQWPEIAYAMGVNHVMLVRDDGTIEMSPAMAHRIRLIDETTSVIQRELEKRSNY